MFATINKRTASLTFYVCRNHRRQRIWIVLLGCLNFVVLPASGFWIAATVENVTPLVVGLLSGITALPASLIISRHFHVSRINDQYVYLKRMCTTAMINLTHRGDVFGNAFPIEPPS
jgi:hypothetical protein